MGSVSFTGNTSNYLHLGGIAGRVYSSSIHNITMKNCANYGDVTYSGTSKHSHIGGILGNSDVSSSNKVFICNSLNYGTITHSGTILNSLYLGGISGYASCSIIENCVSSGKITSTGTEKYNYTGGIVGQVSSGKPITNCLWTSDVGCDVVNGAGSPGITNTSLINTLNTTTMNELNEYTESQDSSTWSRWVMLHLNGGIINNFNQDTQICGLVKSLPVPVKERYTLDYWCVDEACNTKYDPITTEMSGVVDLYAHWIINQYTLTFEENGGSECPPITQDYNTSVTLPKPTKTGYTFAYWCSDPELTTLFTETTMPAENKTLYAHWTINQYTLTFDFGNGTVSSVVLDFNTTIEYPEDMIREGFIFAGWSPKPETMPAENTTIEANWAITDPTEYVEIVFSNKDLSEEKIREIVKDFVPEGVEFTVVNIENESGETKAIIKFVDKEKAKSFVETVIKSSDVKRGIINRIEFSTGDIGSFSSTLIFNTFIYFVFLQVLPYF